MTRSGRPAVTVPGQWVEAALDEIEAVGVGEMAVQSVARRLGVSKGGFYHHFSDRDQLLRAALDLWEERFVSDLAVRFDAVADPRERLHALLLHATVELQPTVIVRLMAAPGDPVVLAALRRAAQERLALLERIFREIGLTPARAAHRAILAYSSYLGLAQLRAQLPEALAGDRRPRAYLRDVEAALLHDM